jgi:arginyl-tRNA synthetase
MTDPQTALLGALHNAVDKVAPGHSQKLALESPKHASHGDFAITVAMPLARLTKQNPRVVAEQLVQALKAEPDVDRLVQDLEIAGPGFINLRLRAAAKQSVIAAVLREGARFGHASAIRPPAQPAPRVMVEFVSANPTGPLHVGHARQGALGDSLCNLFATQGYAVTREFYYNDAGVQIANLTASVRARLERLSPQDAAWPPDGYRGEYIADIAKAFLARERVQADDRSVQASGDVNDAVNLRDFAVAFLRREQDLDLRAFGVRFDSYFLESSLYTDGRVQRTVDALSASGQAYEAEGALWLRTTEHGDDKDRVMRKSDGSFTYFVPDVAYHVTKFERGYARCINCQGSDHHGTIARVRAGLQALNVGVPKGFPDYVLNTMVRVEKGGQEVKISKRAGSYVTLRDLIEWTSRDAVRFFLISRKADTEFVFDVDLAVKQNDENPVFYVQYAHARICSVLAQHRQQLGLGEASGAMPDAPLPDVIQHADVSLLQAPTELALMRKLADYPVMLVGATRDLAPHDVAFYARELAAALHSYYATERLLVDDAALCAARMALLQATRQVLHNALAIVGVSAPNAMHREPRAEPASLSE